MTRQISTAAEIARVRQALTFDDPDRAYRVARLLGWMGRNYLEQMARELA